MSMQGGDKRAPIQAADPVTGCQELADLLALDAQDGGWRNRQCLLNIAGQVMGGQIAAHCLVAALDDDGGLEPKSLQLIFVGAADPFRPYRLETERLRTGRGMAHRSVRVTQEGQVIAQSSAILQSPRGDGPWRRPDFHPDMPQVPQPEDLVPRDVQCGESNMLNLQMRDSYPFLEIRTTPGYVPGDCQLEGGRAYYWARVAQAAPLPPAPHYALLALASDYWYTLPAHSTTASHRPSYMTTSLDHAIWIHSRPDMSDWILVETKCSLIEQGIGLITGHFWSRAGRRVATVAQQALIRRSGSERGHALQSAYRSGDR